MIIQYQRKLIWNHQKKPTSNNNTITKIYNNKSSNMIHNVNIKILIKDILDRYPILEDDRIKLAEIIATAYKKTTTSSITNSEPIKKLIYNEIYGFDIKPEGTKRPDIPLFICKNDITFTIN